MAEPPVWTNRMAIAKFNRKRGVPKDGSQFTLPDIGQVHTVIGVMFWRYRNRFPATSISLVLESACAVCGARYEYNLPWRLQDRVHRTCKAHRGQWRTPAPQIRRRQPAPFREKVARMLLRLLTRESVNVLLTHESAVISLSSLLLTKDRPKRYVHDRRYAVRAALQRLIQDGKLPKGIRVTPTHFIYDP